VKNYTFKPTPIASFALLVLLPAFVALGFWQLQRAHDKQALQAARETRSQAVPVVLTAALAAELERFQPVEVSGDYDAARQFLLDNQILNHQVGYWVMTPLKIAGSDTAVLVNRGWLPRSADLSRLPELPMAKRQVRLRGTFDRFPRVGWKLQGADIPSAGWPAVVQVLDAEHLAQRLGYPVLPYQVLLDAGEDEGYARDWRAAGLDPTKNLGYAMQWFAFALAVLLLYCWYGFKPKSSDSVS